MAKSMHGPAARRTTSTLALGGLLVSFALAGCETPAPPVSTAIPSAWELGESYERPPERKERRRQKRYGQPVHVYVDGKFVTVIKYRELPPELPTVFDRHEEDGNVWYQRRFAWTDFLKAIGVDVDRVKQAHFHGGRSVVSMVEGSEIKRTGEAFGFSFTRSKGGKARMEFPATGIKKNTWVDKLRTVAIYVDKEPPVLKQGSMYLPNGKKVDDKLTAYSDGERHGGTRVYLDGRFQGSFRRRALKTEMLIDPAKPTSPYSLAKVLTSFGIDLAKVKLAQFVNPGDRVMSEQAGSVLRDQDKPLAVSLPPKSRGRIRVESLGQDKIESLLLFADKQPPDRRSPSEKEPGPAGSSTPQ